MKTKEIQHILNHIASYLSDHMIDDKEQLVHFHFTPATSYAVIENYPNLDIEVLRVTSDENIID